MPALLILAVLTAGPLDARAQIAAAKPGDTVALSGVFGQVSASGKFGLILDLAGAVVRPTSREGAILITRSMGVSVINFTIEDDGTHKGLVAREVDGLTLQAGVILRSQKAVALLGVTNFKVTNVAALAGTGDGFGISGSSHGVLQFVACAGALPSGLVHPDCVQLFSDFGPVSYVDVNDSVNFGDSMGFTMHGCDPDKCDHIRFQRDLSSSTRAISYQVGPGGELRDSEARSIPGGRFGTKINAPLAKRCNNTVTTLTGKVISDPPCEAVAP